MKESHALLAKHRNNNNKKINKERGTPIIPSTDNSIMRHNGDSVLLTTWVRKHLFRDIMSSILPIQMNEVLTDAVSASTSGHSNTSYFHCLCKHLISHNLFLLENKKNDRLLVL